MSREYEASAVSLRDVWEALVACRQDHGVVVRVVVYVRPDETKPGTLCVVAQACGNATALADNALVSRQAWPTDRFRTFAALLHWSVWDVYQRLDHARELVTPVDAAAQS